MILKDLAPFTWFKFTDTPKRYTICYFKLDKLNKTYPMFLSWYGFECCDRSNCKVEAVERPKELTPKMEYELRKRGLLK